MKIHLLLMLGLFLLSSQIQARDFELSTVVSGVVKQVNVKAGDKVKKGQVLLFLDQQVFEAAQKTSEKMFHSAQLARDEAKKELDRAKELYERTVLSDHELNLAKIEFAKFDALLAKAESQKKLSAYELKYSQIVAPINGKVKKVIAWPGMVINNSLKNTILLIITK